MPPLILDAEELAVDELREMRAHRLLCDAGDFCELGRGQRLASHQRSEDLGARVVADQRGDADDARPVFHGSILIEPYAIRNRVVSRLIQRTIREPCRWQSPASSVTRSIRSSARRSANMRRTGEGSSPAAAAISSAISYRTRGRTTLRGG